MVFGSVDRLVQNGGDIKKLTWNSQDGTFSEPNDIAVGNYLIHPAFTLGTQELNGIWVGKFETGYNQTNNGESAITGTDKWNIAGAQKNESDSKKIIVKPDVYSWRGITVSNVFKVSYNYNSNINSHMMKNVEWGATAYLSHSAYGKGAEVNINNASDYKTGYSAAPNTNQRTSPGEERNSNDSSKTQLWNTAVGHLASTTGNITGVYDMSGGAWEYVAATMINSGTLLPSDKSGFAAEEITNYMKSGYIDAYSANESEFYKRRILGDATGEMGPFYYYSNGKGSSTHNSWYADLAGNLNSSRPWIDRGGVYNDGLLAGQFDLAVDGAGIGNFASYRLVLTGTPRAS